MWKALNARRNADAVQRAWLDAPCGTFGGSYAPDDTQLRGWMVHVKYIRRQLAQYMQAQAGRQKVSSRSTTSYYYETSLVETGIGWLRGICYMQLPILTSVVDKN